MKLQNYIYFSFLANSDASFSFLNLQTMTTKDINIIKKSINTQQ